MEHIIVIGGGASGMMAALTAAEEPGRRVTLLERQQRVGRKLLATGNGRCNLTNTGAAPENYHGETPDFALPALRAFPPEAALDFFRGLGLVTVEEYGGRVYPLSNSANSVVDVLRFALEARGVTVMCACPAREIRREARGFSVRTDAGILHADKLIVACGGAAGEKLGGVKDGYELLKALGHKRTALRPSLVPLLTAPEYPRALKGVRADCALRLLHGEEVLAESAGELQFTETGLSGPAAFDLSRASAEGGDGLSVSADFFRAFSADEVLSLLRSRCETFPELLSAELLTGMLHNRLGKMLVKYAGLSQNAPLSALKDGELRRVAAACRDFRLDLRGTGGFDQAQVTAGGVRCGGFDPETLESRSVPGLFVCGELLDVDGDCGGYNLQWAWASGRLAGRLGR
jgi:hypothetical protein